MTLRHLKIFVAVCDCGGVTRAARRLYLAQPAVSLAIHELEQYYGVPLFERLSRRLYITPEGERLLSLARQITALFGEAERTVHGDGLGRVHIGSSVTIGTCLMPGYVRAFEERYPGTRVQVTIENSGTLEERLLQNGIDFALIEGVVHTPQIEAEPFLDDELTLVCPPGHPFALRGRATLQELGNERWLLRERGSGTRELSGSALLTKGLRLEPMWESINTRSIVNAVRTGLGVSVLPAALLRQDFARGTLVRVPIEGLDLRRKFQLLRHRSKALSGAAQAFIALVRELGAAPMDDFR